MREELCKLIEQDEDMKDWPNTPGMERIREAFLSIKKPGYNRPVPELNDAKRVLKDTLVLKERQESLKSFQLPALQDTAKLDPNLDNDARIRELLIIAERGNTDETIGLIANIRVVNDMTTSLYWWDTGDKEPLYASLFARLPRDPDWMGWDRMLKTAEGMRALVLENYPEPGTPGIILMSPPEQFQGFPEKDREPFPKGEAQILRDLLKWHGADPWWRSDRSSLRNAG